MSSFSRPLSAFFRVFLFLVFALSLLPKGGAAEATRAFDIPAGEAAVTLKQFAAQAGTQVLFPEDAVSGVTTQSVKGSLGAADALGRMLAGTSLRAVRDSDSGSFVVRRDRDASPNDPNGARAVPRSGNRPDSDNFGEKKVELPAFEVMENKLLNMDIRRSTSDAQPYVIFARERIQNSGAVTVEDFLKKRLPMNTVAGTNIQGLGSIGNTSTINLRGLGANQTLVLIDGHRAVGTGYGGDSRQPDLNGIPLSAVERIEVLPSTASGIYGGGATGGVINVILRRDYSGAELRLTYENAFASDAASRRVDLSAGFNLEDGRTSVLLTASYQDQNELLVTDRNFVQRGRTRILANNPSFYLTGTTPPGGSTANIRSSDGSNLALRNGTPLNSPVTFVPKGYAGASSDNGAAFVANAGRYNFELADSIQFNGGARRGLIGTPEITSLGATIRRQFSPRLQAFVEAFGSDNDAWVPGTNVGLLIIPANVANNPFDRAVRVTVPMSSIATGTDARIQNRRLVGGVSAKLPGEVSAEMDYTWNRMRLSYTQSSELAAAATTAASSGALNIFRDPAQFPVDFTPFLNPIAQSVAPFYTTLQDVTLRLSKPVAVFRAGSATVSALLEHRKEQLGDQYLYVSPTITSFFPERSQTVRSGYLEARVPLVAPDAAVPWIRELELQLAGRADEYVTHSAPSVVLGSASTFARVRNRVTSSNPTIGVRHRPLQGVTLRASYGTGFLPPAVNQLAPLPQVSFGTFTDPRRGNTATPSVQSFSGGYPNLKPESSTSWSAGSILEPAFLPNLRLSVDFTSIRKKDNIQTFPGGIQAIIANEALFPERVTRGANLPGDQPGWPGPITTVDNTMFNIARAEVEAFDVQADYRLELGSKARVEFYSVATWQTHYRLQPLASQPMTENAGLTDLNPLEFRANAGVELTIGSWKFGWSARHFDSYQLTNAVQILSQGSGGRIPSQTYHDLLCSYRFERRSGAEGWRGRLFGELEAQVGVKNLFNTEPPVDVSHGNYLYSRFGDPFLATYFVSVRKTL